LAALDDQGALSESVVALGAFMLEVCSTIAASLSSVVFEALQVARRSGVQQATSADLEAARVECWKAIEGEPPASAHVCATRAVICALYPASQDPFLELQNFLDFALGAGVTRATLCDVLSKHFLVSGPRGGASGS
jgi:hypothetical protein